MGGRLWSSQYVHALETISDTAIRITNAGRLTTPPKNTKNVREGTFTIAKPLAGHSRTPEAYLLVSGNDLIIKEFMQSSVHEFLIIFSLVAAILAVLSALLLSWIRQPLIRISQSLKQETVEPLHALQQQDTEFGNMARLIKNFFDQRAQLLHEIEEHKRSDEELQKTTRRLSQLVATSLDPIFIADSNGLVLRANRAFLDMVGYSEQEVLGKPITTFSAAREGSYTTTTGEQVEIGKQHFVDTSRKMAELFSARAISGWVTYYRNSADLLIPVTQNLVAQYKDDGTREGIFAQKLLVKAGYHVDVADNGEQAVQMLKNQPRAYHIVLMDVQMPRLSGLEAARQIRAWEHAAGPLNSDGTRKHIPIVAMTANAVAGDREACLASGMNDYITKPIKREMVFALLKKWVLPSP